jgi:hypothetical protein
MPNGIIRFELSLKESISKRRFVMNTNQATECVFCGTNTEEQHVSSFGVLYIHPGCLIDLEEILSLTEEELEKSKGTI